MTTENDLDSLHKRLAGAQNTLHKFVLVYGNVGMDGERLTRSEDMMQVLLFETFLQACSDLGIKTEKR